MKFLFQNTSKSVDNDAHAVCTAASLLGTSEYHLFQVAHMEWFGSPATESALERLFSQYIDTNIVPFWMRDFVRSIIDKHRSGDLDAAAYGLAPRRLPATNTAQERSMLFVFAGAMLLFSILIFSIDWTTRIG